MLLTTLAACTQVPDNTFLLPASQGAKMAKQCSPERSFVADTYWQVTPQQAVEFNDKLSELLERSSSNKLREVLQPISDYHRQLIGFSRNNHRYIYGNFYSFPPIKGLRKLLSDSERVEAMVGCDGGSGFWSATLDLQSGAIEKIDTNNLIGGGACHWDFSNSRTSQKRACECINSDGMIRPLPKPPPGLSYCRSM